MKHHHSSRAASDQRGVVLLFSLVALVVLLIAAVALMRSFNTSLFMSGNIAFKRDLQNQGERAIEKALQRFRVGGTLETDLARADDLKTSNYSATVLPTNAQGIPLALQSDPDFLAKGVAANDITPDNEPSLKDQGVTVRYLVDRMATAKGSCTTLGPSICLMTPGYTPAGGSSSQWRSPTHTLSTAAGAAPAITTGTVVYRLTVRVDGPRKTQAFYQSTFTAP
jgi:type IV pilus assembly protein PilX